MECSSTITERRHKSVAADPDAGILLGGISLSGINSPETDDRGDWSWWRVFLPLWVVLGHNALYLTVGFVWLFFAEDGAAEEEVTIRMVTNWRRCCVSSFSRITCSSESRAPGIQCGSG